MSTACPTSIAEQQYDRDQSASSVREYFIAVEQIERVRATAQQIMSGHPITVRRAVNEFDKTSGHMTQQMHDSTLGIQHVADLVSERVRPEIYAGLFRGEPFALRQMQRLVRECAEEVAFYALDLDSNPFVDIESLREVAEEDQ